MSTRLVDYDFDLPATSIAQHPADRRDASRLMLLSGTREPTHHIFSELPDLLQPGDLLVRNNTRVIPARLRGQRPGGGKMELLLIHHLPSDQEARWLCLARPAAQMKPGKTITFPGSDIIAVGEEQRGEGKVVVRFPELDNAALLAALPQIGEMPLPPYIHRPEDGPTDEDQTRYQTTYASRDGAVAAPTAGLHFTPAVEDALGKRGIDIAHITLHVGPGTFRPIKVEDLSDHDMDEEYYEVPEMAAQQINRARQENRRVIAVGTTSTRTLESATNAKGHTEAGTGWTELFIHPGYTFHGIDGLLTNFHLPRSSLLALVASLTGRERILAAYREAIARDYRFYSYGDAMLILP